MALLFDFTNDAADGSPEIVLKAQSASAAEKILLFNILKGNYGSPVVLSGTESAGMATQIKIGFVLPVPEPEEPVEPSDPPIEKGY